MGYQETYDRILQKREETAVEKRKRIRNEQLIEKKKEELDALCSEMYAKKQDVDELKKNSLGNLLRKIAGSYDQSYEKEYREYVEAKLKYDEMTAAVEALQKETERLGSSIRQAEREIDRLYEELSGEPQAAEVLAELEEKKTERYQRLKELKEAVSAVENVIALAAETKKAYEEAKGWATYDTFFGGGLIGDIVKYNRIDDAEELSVKLAGAAERMNKELKDVEQIYEADLSYIDSGSRLLDIWFDNIFTDYSVRSNLKENVEKLEDYIERLGRLQSELNSRIRATESEIKEM
ncbi:MAG TPA: hypothetical protein IAC64_09320 [Candidatus Caccomorpha excrementavium]|nr:hypothetical protein [Candidatus Caccomorpha excrementavium]